MGIFTQSSPRPGRGRRRTQRRGGEEAERRCRAANTWKDSMKLYRVSSDLLDIIRMGP